MPLVFGKIGGGAFLCPIVGGQGVPMDGKAVHFGPGDGHQNFGPVVVKPAGTAGDALHFVAGKILDEDVVSAVIVGVELGAHVSTAPPVFVTDAKIFESPGFFAAVFSSQAGHAVLGIAGDVLDPFHHFLNAAAADIAADVRFGAEQFAQVQEFVGAELVGFGDTAPMRVDGGDP